MTIDLTGFLQNLPDTTFRTAAGDPKSAMNGTEA
jgi:hypothetical protein